MAYPVLPNYRHLVGILEEYSRLKHEYGSKGIQPIVNQAEKALNQAIAQLTRLPIDKTLSKKEPNAYQDILKVRPKGPRRIWENFDEKVYREKLEGALLARMAACTLGAAVEFWDVPKMENLAKELNISFPATNYWPRVPEPFIKRYEVSPRENYSLAKMDGVPVDDDIVYTLLGLLVVEDSGPDFSVADNGKAWVKYLPYACTAEDIALKNLKKGVPAMKAGENNNPYCEWIGADIRSDPWGYMAPGMPEKAAKMAWRDAYLSHRRQGIYGEMFFSAAIAAAFTVSHPVEALEIGLTEIPKECALTRDIKWALKTSPRIKNYKQARAAVEERFKGMSRVHTNNNACLTVFGLTIGGTDFTKVASETVAMGMDNDCTAATAGSIVGAIAGKKGIAPHWTKHFNNTVHSYLINRKTFRIDDLVNRFTRQAKRVVTA